MSSPILRSRIAGLLEFVIAGWAILRFTQARTAAGAAAEATDAATSAGEAFQLGFTVVSITAAIAVGAWLVWRGPTRLIDVLMRISLAMALAMFVIGIPQSIGSLPMMASSLASLLLAFFCWKLVRDDLRLVGTAVLAAGVVAAAGAALLEALSGDRDLGVGGWVDTDGGPMHVCASPAPERARLLARDELGGWCELAAPDPRSGVATVDLPAGRWYLALQAPAPLDPATQLRVLRTDVAGRASVAA